MARQGEDPPHYLGNVYLDILFEQLESTLRDKYPNISIAYEINALASYFTINNQKFSSIDELLQIVKEDCLQLSFLLSRREVIFPLGKCFPLFLWRSTVMRYFVNVNPFEKGFQDYRIERLAMIYTQDLPWILH